MRNLFLFVLTASWLFAADTEALPPQMPAQVTLTSGRVLQKVTVLRWEKDRVVLKHAGGADPVPFAMFKSPAPDELPAIRAAWEAGAVVADIHAKQSAAIASKASVAYSGELFLGVVGSEVFKLANVRIYVLPAEALKVFATETGNYALPKPLAQTATDANGHFSFAVPADQKFIIFAQHQRRVSGRVDSYEWRLPSSQIADPQHVMIGNESRRAGLCLFSFPAK
jgi:hypothetical protein